MKLLILNDCPIFRIDGEYYSVDSSLKFYLRLSEYFSATTMLAPVITGRKEGSLFYKIHIKSNRQMILETFPFESVIEYYRKIIKIMLRNIPIYLRAVRDNDVIIIICPAMNAFLVAFIAGIYRKPFYCYHVGDEEAIVKSGPKYKGLRYSLALIVSNIHTFLYKIINYSRGSFFLSEDLQMKFGKKNKSHLMFTSLVENADINRKNEITKIGMNPTLLYVGRLSHEKGIDYLLQAILILRRQGIQANLLICGAGMREEYQAMAKELVLEDQVRFLGFIPWGEELAKVYRQSDILMVPSLSEGVPKVLLEAMAQDVAIVATNVGGIPLVINHMENGILVPPKNPEALAAAVKLIIESETLRKKLIDNGNRFVQEHTCQKQAQRIAEVMRNHQN